MTGSENDVDAVSSHSFSHVCFTLFIRSHCFSQTPFMLSSVSLFSYSVVCFLSYDRITRVPDNDEKEGCVKVRVKQSVLA